MIKFFRHIRKSLLQQNKMGKYFKYAIGEIILVVIGILIALQVNNWNEQRKSRNNKLSYFENLREEILQNNSKLQQKIKQYKFLDEKHLELANLMSPIPKPISKDKLDVLVNAMTFMPLYNPIKTFINSNNLETIDNAELKKLVAQWNFEIEAYLYDTKFIYDLYYNSIYPFLQENYQLIKLQSDVIGKVESKFLFNHSKILSSAIFENQVAMKSVNHRNAYNQLLVIERLEKDIITKIDSINKAND